jgi:hypothetical protein
MAHSEEDGPGAGDSLAYYQWQFLEHDAKGRETWHALPDLMSERSAHEWALRNQKTIRRVSSAGRAEAVFDPARDDDPETGRGS